MFTEFCHLPYLDGADILNQETRQTGWFLLIFLFNRILNIGSLTVLLEVELIEDDKVILYLQKLMCLLISQYIKLLFDFDVVCN